MSLYKVLLNKTFIFQLKYNLQYSTVVVVVVVVLYNGEKYKVNAIQLQSVNEGLTDLYNSINDLKWPGRLSSKLCWSYYVGPG